jgi:glycosyltransferase involved in cell wall biosynthesis
VSHPLAIVIPAYKKTFFKQALESLARQTNKNFTVYIGDDDSQEDLFEVIALFKNQLDIVYHRFEKNLGGISLVQQWNRCVRLCKNEQWIWLFSDDDIMHDGCVGAFYSAIIKTAGQFSLYRFDTTVIDESDQVINSNSGHPEIESSIDFAINRFNMQSSSSACEYIFKREVFDHNNGFVDFPFGWASDDASWVLFSTGSGIFTINEGRVFWRLSKISISGQQSEFREAKINALKCYSKWFYNYMTEHEVNSNLIKKVKNVQFVWFLKQFEYFSPKLRLFDIVNALLFFKKELKCSLAILLIRILKSKIE